LSKSIKNNLDLLFLDFDGTLTDNRVMINEMGVEHVVCNRSDGLAIKLFKEFGVEVICVSSEKNKIVSKRCQKLKIQSIQAVNDKGEIISDICKEKKIDLSNVAFIGNDLNDIPALKIVGFPIVVNDANDIAKKYAKIILDKSGGEGVVLELLEIIFSSQILSNLYK